MVCISWQLAGLDPRPVDQQTTHHKKREITLAALMGIIQGFLLAISAHSQVEAASDR